MWFTLPRTRRSRRRLRRGAVIVWTALLLVVLVGMVGLVLDGGFLLSTSRQAHNAADAAALAAAFDLLQGMSKTTAVATGTKFVTDGGYNRLTDATVTINIPPASGPYQGLSYYAEAIVEAPQKTFLIRALPGAPTSSTVRARAVAGFEYVASGDGVITLDPDSYPGLKVSGGAQLVVQGSIVVNSEGGGVDENGDPVLVDSNQTAISVTNNSTVKALDVNVVGGVNDPDAFLNYVDGDPNPLHANQPISPDPLLYLPTPTVSNGVVNVSRGAPQSSDDNAQLNNSNDSSGAPNYIDIDPATSIQTLVLQPGIYESIKITGGNVRFVPGIYVLRPAKNLTFSLEISGGNVTAEGVMFYNTMSDYNPVTGAPDSSDGSNPPVSSNSIYSGGVKINAGMEFRPLDTSAYTYDPPVSNIFDNMLFYQRRWNTSTIRIEGNSASGNLAGTLYAKWADVAISGQGTYDAQFVSGSLAISGQGDVTLNYDVDLVGKAPRVFLVE